MTAAAAMERAPTGFGLLAVLQQVLQHSRLLDEQRTVCELLCTSETVNSIVREHCAGRLPVTFSFHSLSRVQRFAKWLSTHAKLLRSLKIQLTGTGIIAGPNTLAATDLVAEALQHAAEAHPAGLLLQQVKLQELHCTPQLLQQLQHSTQLTSLELQLCQRPHVVESVSDCQHNWEQQPEHYQPLVPALAGLTSLRWLRLHANPPHGFYNHVEVLASALPALTQLTALEMDAEPHAAFLQHLPLQLQQLQLLHDRGSEVAHGPLQLDHLTALTSLDNNAVTDRAFGSQLCGLVVVQEGDKLPESLQALVVRDISSAEPFQQLQRLKKLVISGSTTLAADISMIASYCTQLQDVQLGYHMAYSHREIDLESVSAAWSLVPLTRLHIRCGVITTGVLQRIAGLQDTLQLLEINSSTVRAAAQQIAAALVQLTQLHTLQLHFPIEVACRVFGVYDHDSGQHGQPQQVVTAADTEFAVSQAIASLPKLTDLHIGRRGLFSLAPWDLMEAMRSEVPGIGAALLPLVTATQITKLSFTGCGMTDHALQRLVSKLTNLRSLSVTDDKSITTGCLPCIVDNLSSLEYLDLLATFVTREDLTELQSLGKLQGVQVVALPRQLQMVPLLSLHVSDIAD